MVLLPRKVEEVVITVPNHLYDNAVAAVAEAGVLHVASPPKVEAGRVTREYRAFYARVSERVSRLESFFRAIGEKPRTVKGVTIEAGGWEEAFEAAQARYRDVEEAFDRGVSRLQEIENKLGELQSLRVILEPIKHVKADVRRAYLETAFMGYSIGYISTRTPELVEDRLRELAEKHGVVVAVERVDKERLAVAVGGAPKDVPAFMQEARRLGWTPISIPEDLPGSPAEAYDAVSRMIGELMREHDSIVERLRKRLGELAEYYTVLLSIRHAAEILANTVKTRTVSMFRGYVDRGDRRRLEKKLAEALRGAFMIAVLSVRKAHEKVPTKVDLPRVLQPFHNIVRMYGEPDPDEVVPTVFLAVTMPLIFGLMFPDTGHGLLVLLFALFVLSKDNVWRAPLAVMAGVSMITGILAGEFFGPVVAEKLGIPEMWEKLGFEAPPLAQPTYAFEAGLGAEAAGHLLFRIITLSLWIGAFMLSFGTFLGFIDALLKGDKEEAFASKLPTFIFFFSATLPFMVIFDVKTSGAVIGAALGISDYQGYPTLQAVVRYGALLGLLWKILGEPIAMAIEGESPLKGLGRSFMETYEMVAMVLGNVPSFLRIMGLGLAHAGLMLGFAELYHLMAHAGVLGLIGGIIVYALGNLMVAALEAIIVLAHSLRLHFYEWFSKFYHGQGLTFTPVRLEGVRIIIRPRPA